MASTDNTQYYQLNQWISTDKPQMVDFNSDNQKIDQALNELSESIATGQGATETHAADLSNPHQVTAAQAGAVPVTRTVNSKALVSDITLTASDVGAEPSISAGTTGQFWRGDKTFQALNPATVGAEPARTLVTQAEAETGTSTTVRAWTPERVRQAAQAASVGDLQSQIQRAAPNIYSTAVPVSPAFTTSSGLTTIGVHNGYFWGVDGTGTTLRRINLTTGASQSAASAFSGNFVLDRAWLTGGYLYFITYDTPSSNSTTLRAYRWNGTTVNTLATRASTAYYTAANLSNAGGLDRTANIAYFTIMTDSSNQRFFTYNLSSNTFTQGSTTFTAQAGVARPNLSVVNGYLPMIRYDGSSVYNLWLRNVSSGAYTNVFYGASATGYAVSNNWVTLTNSLIYNIGTGEIRALPEDYNIAGGAGYKISFIGTDIRQVSTLIKTNLLPEANNE
jgi:hypothetical protein